MRGEERACLKLYGKNKNFRHMSYNFIPRKLVLPAKSTRQDLTKLLCLMKKKKDCGFQLREGHAIFMKFVKAGWVSVHQTATSITRANRLS